MGKMRAPDLARAYPHRRPTLRTNQLVPPVTFAEIINAVIPFRRTDDHRLVACCFDGFEHVLRSKQRSDKRLIKDTVS